MKKAILALTMTVVLIAMLVVPALAASGDLVYEMTAAEVDGFLADNDNGAQGLRAAGSPDFSKEGSGINLYGRTADWNALDLKAEVFADAGKDYTIIVGFSSPEATSEFAIRNTDSPYGILAQSAAGTKATVTYKGKGSEFQNPQRGVRLATLGTEEFTVTSIKVYEGDPPVASAGDKENPKTGDNVIFVITGILALAAGATVLVARKVKA